MAGIARRLGVAAVLLLGAAAGLAQEIRWQPPVEIARGAGERGGWRQNDSRYDFVDDPTLAWSPRGELAVAWVDQRRKAVLLQRRATDGTPIGGAPVDVSRQPQTFSWLPRLAFAPDDANRLYVLWQEIIFSGGGHGGEILFAASADGGRSFAPPLNLSRSTAGDGKGRINRNIWHNGSLDLVATAGGGVLAAWTEYDGRLWVARSRDGGRGFSAPLLVAGAPPAPPARAPSLAVGADGVVALAWATGEQRAGDIHVARSDDGGARFGPPRPAAITPGYSDAPKLAFGPDGVLHLVHAETGGGPFEPSAVRHLRSTDGGRSFGPSRVISAPLPPGAVSASFPALAIDARGRVVASWELQRGPGLAPAHGLAIAVAADGVRFGPPHTVSGSIDAGGGANGSTQGMLMRKLAVTGDGEVALVNSAVKVGSHSRVWLLRGRLR